jgi:hypothetical protein
MKVVSKIDTQGTIISIHTTPTTITFVKGDRFKEGLTDETMVMKGGYPIPLASYRREELFSMIDAWIEGVEE